MRNERGKRIKKKNGSSTTPGQIKPRREATRLSASVFLPLEHGSDLRVSGSPSRSYASAEDRLSLPVKPELI